MLQVSGTNLSMLCITTYPCTDQIFNIHERFISLKIIEIVGHIVDYETNNKRRHNCQHHLPSGIVEDTCASIEWIPVPHVFPIRLWCRNQTSTASSWLLDINSFKRSHYSHRMSVRYWFHQDPKSVSTAPTPAHSSDRLSVQPLQRISRPSRLKDLSLIYICIPKSLIHMLSSSRTGVKCLSRIAKSDQ